jgi:hypothetical protein
VQSRDKNFDLYERYFFLCLKRNLILLQFLGLEGKDPETKIVDYIWWEREDEQRDGEKGELTLFLDEEEGKDWMLQFLDQFYLLGK